MHVTIIGGGIIGLTAAYYLVNDGVEVTIIDKGNLIQGCSHGNAGYICPSHFVPLASPGIVAQGLKWMLNPKSPFYIKPRLDMGLVKWGWAFWKSSNKKASEKNTLPLHELLQYSRSEMLKLAQTNQNIFDLKSDGCLMMYRSENTAHHEEEGAKLATQYGVKTQILDKKELVKWEPNVSKSVLGAVYYEEDCHINPMKYMEFMSEYLIQKGVKFILDCNVVSIQKNGQFVKSISTAKGVFEVDQLLVATGAWLPQLTKDLGISLLLQAGKGYSVTYKNPQKKLTRPAILVDDRVALTPFGNDIRVGGTMEIVGNNEEINMNRVSGIIDAVNLNFDFGLKMPVREEVWAGLRPCSPDGLPYLGRVNQYQNLTLAGGHAMLGISLAAGTGALIKSMICNQPTSINASPFSVDRFS